MDTKYRYLREGLPEIDRIKAELREERKQIEADRKKYQKRLKDVANFFFI